MTSQAASTGPRAVGERGPGQWPTTCQLSGKPTQDWTQSHIQFNDGRNDGFVKSGSGPVAMG